VLLPTASSSAPPSPSCAASVSPRNFRLGRRLANARRGKAGHSAAGHGPAGQGTAGPGKARQGKARQGKGLNIFAGRAASGIANRRLACFLTHRRCFDYSGNWRSGNHSRLKRSELSVGHVGQAPRNRFRREMQI
jgi:hypothetical protein